MKEWRDTTSNPRRRQTVDQHFESFVPMVDALHGRLKDKEVTHIATCSYLILGILLFVGIKAIKLEELIF